MRKLIRPTREEMERLKKTLNHSSVVVRHRTPESFTGEEARYLQLHADHKIPIVVKLHSGEEVKGWVEYYDLNFVRITVAQGANRFLYKREILYLSEAPAAHRHRRNPRHL